jgi:branched-chain amino acid transport system ATP-binding protein
MRGHKEENAATDQCRAAAPLASDCILETRGLVKEFKGFVAVADVNLRVQRGQIHALIGPNGAGKTTVFNLLTKFLIPTRGSILFNGQDITFEKPAQIARRGIIRSFQISATFPHLTVLENVRIGLQRSSAPRFTSGSREKSLEQLTPRALQLLDTVGLTEFAEYITVELPYGRKRALEIATTLAMEPELMLLDEPTQGMGHEDVERVTDLIKKVAANRTILMVEHNMSVVAKIATRSRCWRAARCSPRALRGGLEEPAGARGLHGQHRGRTAGRPWMGVESCA